MSPRKTWQQMFRDHVNVIQDRESCWLWTGLLGKTGYGKHRFFHLNTPEIVHRAFWKRIFQVSHLDHSEHICHKCDVRNCVRPSHLFLGNNEMNIQDKIAKGRQICGEQMGGTKLTEAQVTEIRNFWSAHHSKSNHKDIASRYGISLKYVGLILRGIYWRHLPVGQQQLKAKHSQQKISWKMVGYIRKAHESGKWSCKEISIKLGVHVGTIHKIVYYRARLTS